MNDSIREVLQGIASDGSAPSDDLAAGAYKRARRIGRQRMAVVAGLAVVAVAAVSVGGVALAGMNDTTEPPPAINPTTEAPTEPEETFQEDEDPDEGQGGEIDCERPASDWSGWGDSDSMRPLTELPEELYVLLGSNEMPLMQVHRYDGAGNEYVIEGETYRPRIAPDGNRYVTAMDCSGGINLLDDAAEGLASIGIDSMYCTPSWSPDSNFVTITTPSPDFDDRYLLNLETGEQTELPEEVSCSPVWSGDGQYLVDFNVAMRPDGSDRVDFPAAATWSTDSELPGLSGVSADLGRACLQMYDAEYGASGHISPWRCDKYVDTATGEELELPVATEGDVHVVFLVDGAMIVGDQVGDRLDVTLVSASGSVLDERVLDVGTWTTAQIEGYYTG
ncbi:hypothetical protein AB0B28_11640 [Glycomyces sp. NPDC046736]|uniref:hypothetical protein n=1 Tax=Glycomyces sp. NPDC046736 TaxID=3155615 RepID=UPI0033F6F843